MVMRSERPRLGLILPAYNEEAVLATTLNKLVQIKTDLIKKGMVRLDSFILIVDDGSTDTTWDIIYAAHQEHPNILGVKLSRNFGHQPALIAGMSEGIKLADIVITLDADLQDNPDIISRMVADYQLGNEIVYAVRSSREQDTWFKKYTALGFYKTLSILGVEIIPNHADFRLMSRLAVQALLKMPERHLFLRAMVPLVGYQSSQVFYERGRRQGGVSKYPLKKMLNFALDGITSFSVQPMRYLFGLGLIVLGVAGVEIIYTLAQKIIGNTQAGWSSLMISIWLLGSFNLIAIGVVGVYIGKIFTEVKHRPRFEIESITNDQQYQE